jgi:pyruvate,water dikinase
MEEFPYKPPRQLEYLTRYADFGDLDDDFGAPDEVTVEVAGKCPECGSSDLQYADDDEGEPHLGRVVLCHACGHWCYEDEVDTTDKETAKDEDNRDVDYETPKGKESHWIFVAADPSDPNAALGTGATVLPFGTPGASDKSQVGGKGANLSMLSEEGFPVPPGFNIPAYVFESYVPDSQHLIQLVQNKNFDEAVRYVLAMDVPEDDILAAFDNLGFDRVAVRSSAVAEDSSEASYAGRQSTYLNQSRDGNKPVDPGQPDYGVIEAVKHCWASWVDENSVNYRANVGELTDLRMAVVVQAMVPAESAGTAFTEDTTGGGGLMLIRAQTINVQAVPGLGEGMVSGEKDVDQYRIDRESGQVQHMEILNGGLLRPEHIAQLVQFGLQLEKRFEGAQDIEWALHGGDVYLLQTRPITT